MSVTLMFMIRNARRLEEAEQHQYGRKRRFINPETIVDIKPNKTAKYTISIPKHNNYDFSTIDNLTWLELEKTKIRKVIKPDGDHHFIIAPTRGNKRVPLLKVNSSGDIFIHKKDRIIQYKKGTIPMFYSDIIHSLKTINKHRFPLSNQERETIKNSKLINRLARLVKKLIKK